ncbi:low affinity immunoglobulin gamma Fc region receptor II-like [Poecile atricapillus]|uniref:low affinity immunoglobulin gamma Fc region receptor II-like n=1 Tax=Poecile atricapillus TaxID=48891 RepID=UPI00273A2DDF|nr:low affinity immunoglobulin gamma Fc region receptor II-like [Poecile atricapillus]
MPCPRAAVPSPALALARCCPLSPAGAPSPQLLVEPPWRPAVLWDRVTLTCRGSGTAGDTTWYKDGRRWRLEGPESFTVTENGTYECDRAGSGLSPPVTVTDEWLVLQVPAGPLVEGDTVTLRCRSRWYNPETEVRFYHGEKDLGKSLRGSVLSLSPPEAAAQRPIPLRGLVEFVALTDVAAVGSGVSDSARGRSGWGVPALPAPAPGCSCGLAPLEQRGAPPAPPEEEEEEVLYSRVVSSQRPGGDTGLGHRDTSPIAAAPTQSPRPGALAGSPRAPTLQDPRVIYAELRRPHGRARERGDIDGDVL